MIKSINKVQQSEDDIKIQNQKDKTRKMHWYSAC